MECVCNLSFYEYNNHGEDNRDHTKGHQQVRRILNIQVLLLVYTRKDRICGGDMLM